MRNKKKLLEKLVNGLYEIIIKKDASLIEINPLIITKKKINLFRCKNEF